MNKPFDLLAIVDPEEFERGYNNKRQHILGLADLCRRYNIPVRVRLGYQQETVPQKIREFFFNCNYFESNSESFELENRTKLEISNANRIIVIGGLLCYETSWIEDFINQVGLSLNQFENNGDSSTAKFALVSGCVPSTADAIYHRMLTLLKEPQVLIDPRASVGVNAIDDEFNFNFLYQLCEPELRSNYLNPVITKKVLRDSLFD